MSVLCSPGALPRPPRPGAPAAARFAPTAAVELLGSGLRSARKTPSTAVVDPVSPGRQRLQPADQHHVVPVLSFPPTAGWKRDREPAASTEPEPLMELRERGEKEVEEEAEGGGGCCGGETGGLDILLPAARVNKERDPSSVDLAPRSPRRSGSPARLGSTARRGKWQ